MILLCTILSALAQGDEARQAEHVRLSETMQKLASRNAWEGVERTYQELGALGIPLTDGDHYLAAQAAWSLGDVDAVRLRLEQTLALRDDQEIKQWLAEIHNHYSTAQLTSTGSLEIAEVPFAADQRAAVDYASAQLQSTGHFSGMLPNGNYTLGEHAFELFPGCPDVVIGASRSRPRRERSAPAGLQAVASAGVALSRAGDPLSAGIQPAGFTGPGVRLGIGAAQPLGQALGARLEVGYHGLFTSSATLHRGYLTLTPTWSITDALQLQAGPEVGLGHGRTHGLDSAAYDSFCIENPEDARCGWVDRDAIEAVEVVGVVRSAGVTAGLSVPWRSLGRLEGGLSLLGGVQSDTLRLYPWTQLALSFRRL